MRSMTSKCYTCEHCDFTGYHYPVDCDKMECWECGNVSARKENRRAKVKNMGMQDEYKTCPHCDFVGYHYGDKEKTFCWSCYKKFDPWMVITSVV